MGAWGGAVNDQNGKIYKFYLFNSFYLITFWGDGLTEEVIIISILQKTPEFFIFSRLFCIRDSKEVILAHEPVAKTAVLNN